MKKLLALSFAAAALFAAHSPAFAVDETRISGTFDGCDWDKTYELMDGRTLTCHGYGYRYAYAPRVIVLDSMTVLIDDQEFYASVD